MGRSYRVFTIDGQHMRTGRPKLDRPYAGGERIEGPPYHFNIVTDKENLEHLIKGGQLVTFEEWGTSCCIGWTWFQLPIQLFERVVFHKYEHLIDDYAATENDYVMAFFTADEMWRINGTLMEEIPHEPNQPWSGSSPMFQNVKKMAWQEGKAWKLINGVMEAVPYETRPKIARSY